MFVFYLEKLIGFRKTQFKSLFTLSNIFIYFVIFLLAIFVVEGIVLA